MKDLKQLLIFAGGSLAIILALVSMSRMENIPSSALVFAAIMLVIVLPVIISIKISKKERENAEKNR